MDQEQLSRYQQEFARIGEAINQCKGCGVFRLDGLPAILHREDCADRPHPADLLYGDQIRLRRLYGLDLSAGE